MTKSRWINSPVDNREPYLIILTADCSNHLLIKEYIRIVDCFD